MNKDIFDFIKQKRGKEIPFEYKVLNNLPLTRNDLIINSNIDFSNKKINKLPNNMKVYGNLDLFSTNLEKLPNNLYVEGYVCISHTKISSLPDDLIVNGYLHCYFSYLSFKLKENPLLFEKYQKQVKGAILI